MKKVIIITILLLIFSGCISGEDPKVAETVNATDRIEKTTRIIFIGNTSSYVQQLDTDPEPDGLKIELYVYDTENNVVKAAGTLDAILFTDIGTTWPSKGEEIDRWRVKINENDYGTYGQLYKVLIYHNESINHSGFGWMDYTFTTDNGEKFNVSDEYVMLYI